MQLLYSYLDFFGSMYHRSGTDEQYRRKEQLLTEAAELFDEAAQKKKSQIEKSKQKKKQRQTTARVGPSNSRWCHEDSRTKKAKGKKRGK